MLCATSKIRLFWRRYPSYYEADYGNGNRHSLINSNYYYDLFKYEMNMPSGKNKFSAFRFGHFSVLFYPTHIHFMPCNRTKQKQTREEAEKKTRKRAKDEEGKNE